jgi:cephalosporin-C deacetylase-like acetyl esterase
LYADVQCAYENLQSRYNVRPQQIVLYGQSIGTVPTVDLAAREKDIAAVVLHSPLMSGMRVAFPATQRTWCFDAFPRWSMHALKYKREILQH